MSGPPTTRAKRGFTLVELIAVIVVLAILAGVAVPRFFSHRQEALESAEAGVVSAVRSGISTFQLNESIRGESAFPEALDTVSAGQAAAFDAPLFAEVLDQPITSDWAKGETEHSYVSPLGNIYEYSPGTGAFTMVSGSLDNSFFGPGNGGGSGGGAGGDSQGVGGEPRSLADLQAMSIPELLAASLTPAEFALLSAEQLNAFSPEQLAAFSPAHLAALGEAQLTGLGYDHIEAISSYLTADQIPLVRPDQLAMLSAEAYAALSVSQRAAMTEAQLAERAVSEDARALAYRDFRSLDPAAMKYLLADQVASIPDNWWMSRLSADQRAGLLPRQVQALDTAKVSLRYLTEAQRQHLSVAQLAAMPYTDMRYVPVERVADIAIDVVAQTPDNWWMSRMSADQRAALTSEQVQSLNTASVSISYLTLDQRSQLTTSQVESISYKDTRYLPTERVAEVPTETIAQIPDNWWMSRMSVEQRGALTTAQVQALDTANVSIKYLTDDQRTLLSTPQLASIGYQDTRYVPAERVAEVPTETIAQIPDNWWMSRMSAEQRGALTTAQVQALDTANVSIKYLTDDQRTQLSTPQLASIGYQDTRYVPAERVAEVPTETIAQIPDDWWMSRMSTDQRAALSTAQVQSVNTSSASIKYLTTAQRSQLTTAQLTSISYRDTRYVPVERMADVAPETIAAIPDSWWWSRLNNQQVQALSQSQVLAISDASYDLIDSRLTDQQRAWRETALAGMTDDG